MATNQYITIIWFKYGLWQPSCVSKEGNGWKNKKCNERKREKEKTNVKFWKRQCERCLKKKALSAPSCTQNKYSRIVFPMFVKDVTASTLDLQEGTLYIDIIEYFFWNICCDIYLERLWKYPPLLKATRLQATKTLGGSLRSTSLYFSNLLPYVLSLTIE